MNEHQDFFEIDTEAASPERDAATKRSTWVSVISIFA